MRGRHSNIILLADPPVAAYNFQGAAFPNLGLLYLAAALRERFPDHDVRYVDSLVSARDHLALVRDAKPFIYGLSYASPYAGIARQLLNSVKEASPGTSVLCGGAHPTTDPEGVLAGSLADIACIGEGEITAVRVTEAILSGNDLGSVAGITYRGNGGRIVRNVLRRPVDALDALQQPAWDLVDFRRFAGCRQSRGVHSTAIVASRGCPYDCAFCSNPVWKVSKPWFRARSPDNVAQEVEVLYRRGVREIYLRSDEMNADVEWATAVFRELARLRHDDLVFQCNLCAKPVTPALADAMALARCWLCHVGIESGSQRVLDGVRKHVTLAEIREALTLLKSRGLKTYGFFMLYQAWEEAGVLQVESTAEVAATLKLILELRVRNLLDYSSWNFATPYPSSALHRSAMKFQRTRERHRHRMVVLPWDLSMRLPGISTWEMVGMRALGMLVQGGLFLSDGDSFNLRTAAVNLRCAASKMRYMVRL